VQHERFEWDPEKADKNLVKHRVSFEETAAMLADPFWARFHFEDYDGWHSRENEDRWITTGSYPFDRRLILVVSWTPRLDLAERVVTRIISARLATRRERKCYEKQTHR
jgi:uncharacterized protein